MASANRPPRSHEWPLTTGRSELLSNRSDMEFRRLLHGLMSYGRMINDIRSYFAEMLGISGVQYEILMAVQRLEGTEGISVSDTANWIRRSPAFVTNEVKALRSARLLTKEKAQDDRRKVLLRLTSMARKRIAELAPVQREVNDLLFETLSADEFKTMVKLIDQLLPCGEKALHRIELLKLESGG